MEEALNQFLVLNVLILKIVYREDILQFSIVLYRIDGMIIVAQCPSNFLRPIVLTKFGY